MNYEVRDGWVIFERTIGERYWRYEVKIGVGDERHAIELLRKWVASSKLA